MSQVKDFIQDLFKNRRNIAALLVLGIAILAVLIGVRLVQNTQIFQSRASGAGENGAYNTVNGVKTLAQMRTELKNSGWANDIITRESGNKILQLYNRNRNNIGGNAFNCVVNTNNLNNMPSTIQTPVVGEEVAISIVMKLEQPACNTWFINPRITNLTTGKRYGDWHPVGIGDISSPHACRNGRNPVQMPFGIARNEYEGAGRFDQGSYVTEGSDCFFGIDTPGRYKVEIALGARDDANNACKLLPSDMNHEGVGLYSSCEFVAVANRGDSPPGTTDGTSGNGYVVSGFVKDSSGNGVSGKAIEVHKSTGEKQAATTDSSGKFTISNFIQSGNLYAVRPVDNNIKTTGGGHTWISCNNVNKDTDPNQGSYECQQAGKDDCAGPAGVGGQSGRCNFTVQGSSTGNPPSVIDQAYQGTGTVTCNANNVATFNWTVGNFPGKTITNYLVRINKSPADWAPDSSTPPGTVQDGDRAVSAGTANSLNVSLVAGQYLDWTIQAGFSDGSVSQVGPHFGEFLCPSSTTTPSPSVTSAPGSSITPQGGTSMFTTTDYWVSEDPAVDNNPEASQWSLVPLNLRFRYNPTGTNQFDYTLLPRICVTQPCDDYPREDRTVYILFIGKDSAGNIQKKVEKATILLAKPPTLTSALCEISSTGVGSVVTLKGAHFGPDSSRGSVQVSDNTVSSIATWSDTEVVANLTGSITGTPKVMITTSEGQKSQEVTCGVGKSQLEFKAMLACKAPNQPLTAADVQVDEISVGSVGIGSTAGVSSSKTILKQSNVSFGTDGKAALSLPEFIEGKAYKLIISARNVLRKVIPFTASKGTTVLEDQNIHVGDVYPANGDCTVNTLDKNEMVRSWSLDKDVVRKSDLNGDGRVNSIDYSCLLVNFNKSCDN